MHDRITSVSKVEKITGKFSKYEKSWFELNPVVSIFRYDYLSRLSPFLSWFDGGRSRWDEAREFEQSDPIEDNPV
jgi:hypothetical protein